MITVTCAHCGQQTARHQLVCASGPELPRPGDASVCSVCGKPSMFELDETTGALRCRVPTADENAALETHPSMRAIRSALSENHDSVQSTLESARKKVTNDRG